MREKIMANEIPKKQKLNYGLYFIGQNVSYIIVSGYLSTYALDIGIAAYALSVILLVIKVWDAMNDTLFGFALEKIHLKGGKYHPWIRLSVFLIPITTILVFAIPSSLSLWLKSTWLVVSYSIWDLAYTMGDVPLYAMTTTMTDVPQERTNIISIGRAFGMLGSVLASIILPIVEESMGSWFIPVSVVMVIFTFTMVPICSTKKFHYENYTVKREKDPTFKQMLKYVFGNKYMLIFYIAMFVWYSGNLTNSLSLIFARECLGNGTLSSVLSVAMLIPWMIMPLIVPAISKRIDKTVFFMICFVLQLVIGVVQYFVGYESLGLMLAIMVVRNIPLGFVMCLIFTFIGDICEYGTYKNGIDAKGIGFTAHTFFTKLMTAFQTVLATFCLGLIGYVEGDNAIQIATLPHDLWIVYALVPVIASAIALPIFLLYKLRDKDIALMAKCNNGSMPREECEAQLSRKY